MGKGEKGGRSGSITTPARPSGTQAVDRALTILSCFTPKRGELGISELSNELGLTPSTVHRIVRALVARGYLAQDVETERYRLGPASMALGQIAQQHLGLIQVRSVLEQLGRDTGESVNLGVRAQGSVVVLIRVASQQALRFEMSPGQRLALHATSMGKALLAFSPDPREEIARLASGPELPRFTRTTLTKPEELEAELARIREQGYSIDEEESIEGVRCVGVPVLAPDGLARAAIALQAPAVRMPDYRVESLAERLVSVAKEVGQYMHLSDIQSADDLS